MTYKSSSTKNYEFTAFTASDIAGGSLQSGSVFAMPAYATTCITVKDDDIYLSGDKYKNENADDSSYQTATIDQGGSEVGNGGQIYAESYFWVTDQHGNKYVLIEIEQEGTSDDYFTFYNGSGYSVPPADAELTVGSKCNVTGDWIDFKCLDGGDKTPVTGWIKGRLTNDADCNDNEWNDVTHAWDKGIAGQTVQLIDLAGNVVATSVTDSNGIYMFDVAAGDYRVQFPKLEGFKFSAKDSGVDEHFDSDADANGLTDIISVVAGETIANIDAGLKQVFVECDDPNAVKIDFEGFAKGTVLDNEYAGVTIVAQRYGKDNTNANDAMVFDTDDPTGDDSDLATSSQGNVLIISEDNDSNDPDDNAEGGKVFFHFDDPVSIFDLKVIDTEEGGFVDVFDADGNLLKCVDIPKIGDGAIAQVIIDQDDVSALKVRLNGSGAIDDICYVPAPVLGSIEGRIFCDLDCDGLDGTSTVVDGKEYTMEAEGMHMYNFCTVNGDQASEGKLVKLKCAGGNGDLWKDFGGESGTYDLTVFVQDENDGQSLIMVKVNGEVVGTIKLDRDSDGGGSDDGGFSQFTLEDIQIGHGDKVQLWVDGKGSEFVRVDKIEFTGEDSTTTTAEPPKAGVEVKLVDASGAVIATTMTDADGNYQFDSVEDGDYKVMVTLPDGQEFTLQDVNGNANDDIDSDVNDMGMTDTITISGGNDVSDIDAGLCEVKEGSLSGRYFCDDNNNGRDDGEPGIAGVTVELLDSAGDPTGATVMTAADGSYSFGNLAPGSYGVKFTYAGDKTLIEKDAPGSDDTNDSDATDLGMGMSEITGITVVAGANTPDNDAGVETKPGSLSGRYFCDDNNNGRDDGEPGIAGVTVELLDSAGNPTGATVMTAADGSYSFGNLAPGSYGVKFTYAGDKTLIEKDAPGSDDTNDSDATDLGMGMSEITGITVVAGANTPDNDAGVETKPGSLSGRYFCDDNNNGRDDGEPGIAGVTVELLDSAGNPTGATVMTAADGSYSFGNLAPGSYGVKFTYAGDKTLIEKDAPGSDDTNDSDATDLGMGMSQITGITVVAGANTPDNDAGVETKPGSLSGRYFCDDNNNGVDDGEPGIAGVTVELLDAAGDPTDITTTTAADGSYSFGNLAPGSYGVKFTYAGDKTLIEANVGMDDTIDSDATDLGMGMSQILGITVNAGMDTPDNDAGVEQLNRPPEPTPDEAMICYDEAIAVDVLTNDSDPDMDSLMVKAVNGMLIGVNDPKLIDGVEVTLNADGTLTFDAGGKDGPMGHLLTGQEETRQYTYTVDDGNGGMATTTVDVTFCGATDTIEKVFTLLPVSVKYQVRDENKDQDGNLDDFIFEKGPEAFTVNVIDASMILAGTFVSAYCLSYNDAVASIPQQEAFAGEGSPLQLMADVKLADADTVGADLVDQVGINGQTAAANLDLINWIVNQRFENQDNGDGPDFEAYTDFEIQAAIWALTDGQDLASRGAVDGIVLLPDPQNGIYGTKENAQEIVDAAIANGEGFVADAAAGDLVGVFLDADNQPPAANVQPFIVGYDLSDLFDDCIC